jgi:hypothetical protein
MDLTQRDDSQDVGEMQPRSYVDEIADAREKAARNKKVDIVTGEILAPEVRSKAGIRRAKQKSMDPLPILKAINEAFTQEQIVVMLREAAALASLRQDPVALLAVVKFITSYQVGTPVNRNLSATISQDRLMELFSDTPVDKEE